MLIPLPNIISNFREKAIAFGADIKEMYHQIRIRDADKQAQRFLFGYDSSGRPQVYVMDVATFGATCAPSSAQYIKTLMPHNISMNTLKPLKRSSNVTT